VVLAATVVFVLLAYLYYNRTFVQHQGRYLFPALIPIALGVALSLAGLLHLLRFPDRLRPLAFAAPYLGLAALDLYALWRFIVPALTFSSGSVPLIRCTHDMQATSSCQQQLKDLPARDHHQDDARPPPATADRHGHIEPVLIP
jgi:hypothetical protein